MQETPGTEAGREVKIEVQRRQNRPKPRWPWLILALVVVAAAAYGVYYLLNRSDEAAEPVDQDTGVVLPQNPSLSLEFVDGVASVLNDGNVTMSSIEVRDAEGSAVCTLGTLAPDESAACDEAPEGGAYTAYGEGPQGQQVEVASP
jgi:hypothetical protein